MKVSVADIALLVIVPPWPSMYRPQRSRDRIGPLLSLGLPNRYNLRRVKSCAIKKTADCLNAVAGGIHHLSIFI